MSCFLGIDTSNYTTSASVYDSESGKMIYRKKLLPVKKGECGLRQSDAVFHHVQQLPDIVDDLFREFDQKITAIGVSIRPRDVEGSYMPCFTVGSAAARILSSVMKVPLYTFSHQCGHIAAAVYSAGCMDLIDKSFYAFHVSGGTTEALLVKPDKERIFDVTLAAKTLDLNAGQLIDRVGVMLGLSFPCGAQLEKLAAGYQGKINARPTIKDGNCCLSGIENICRREFDKGSSEEYISALCLKYVEASISAMCDCLIEKQGQLPVIFAGGVMSDRIIKDHLQKKYNSYFAMPDYSTDNASGTALLCCLKHSMIYKV